MKAEVRNTGLGTAAQNMELDAQYLRGLAAADRPIIHLYRWEGPCATHGHFIQPEALLDLESAKAQGLKLAKRPTGGGMIFHIWDLAFSVLVPAEHHRFSLNTMENYALVNRAVANTVKQFSTAAPSLLPHDPKLHTLSQHFCMAKPTKYDVMLDGAKVGGAAQRRTRDGFLHQGTIFLVPPDLEWLQEILRDPEEVTSAMRLNSRYLSAEQANLEALRDEVEQTLVKELQRELG